MIKIALCDDNEIFLRRFSVVMSEEFAKCTDDFEIESFTNGIVLMNQHKFEPFDIIFLDIDMPKMTGFDVAKTIRTDFSNSFIIFVTNHSELVYESMDFQPFQFIRKDLNVPLEESVSSVVKKLMKHLKQNDKVILEDDYFGRHAVYIRDIIYVESDKHYINYHIMNMSEPIKMRGSINDCEEKYSRYNFVRIHRRYLINLKYISDYDYHNDKILLGKIEKELPMSKMMRKEIDEKYTLYLRSMI